MYDRATAHTAGGAGDADSGGEVRQRIHRVSLHNISMEQPLHPNSNSGGVFL